MTKLSSVFMGTPDFALPSLQTLWNQTQLKAVVTGQDKKTGRGQQLLEPQVKSFAREKQIPCFQPSTFKNNQEILQQLSLFHPDLLIVIAYGFILPEAILNIPTLYPLNIHASLLPKYRGASPIQTALLNNDSMTGICIQRMVLKMDAGDVLLCQSIPIALTDNCVTLSEKLSQLAADCLDKAIELIASGKEQFVPQKEDAASYCKKIQKDDAIIDWTASAQKIFGIIRAYCQWPVAETNYKGKKIFILSASLVDENLSHNTTGIPGEVVQANKYGLILQCGTGFLSIEQIQLPGKKPISYKDFLNGYAVEKGARFGQ